MVILPDDNDDPAVLEVNWRDGLCWVQISETSHNPAHSPINRSQSICCETMGSPAWECDADGKIIWYNAAYAKLLAKFGETDDHQLFPETEPDGIKRVKLVSPKDGVEWFEVSTYISGTRTMYHAAQITPLVDSEEAQRSFVQTLAKSFADLPIGLAIFNRAGQLGMFNPALVDLTGLQPKFLATQPTMLSFFDQLRENRRMPEPKNYNSWRQEIGAVISAASGGLYQETWVLEDGRTYAVQGRPHPDGATAFLIEDISSEVTLTRNFRNEVQQYEAILDNIEDPLVVFSSAGILTFCNAAYREVWEQNPEAAFADVTISDAIDLWRTKTVDGVNWASVSEYVQTLSNRKEMTLELIITGEGPVQCDLTPIAMDATLFRFRMSRLNEPVSNSLLSQKIA
ncbi:MAG: PAS-domain containing protein [Sulfitobacter sp.]